MIFYYVTDRMLQQKVLYKDLFTMEKKLCTHQHHKENLLNYLTTRKTTKVPKGLLLKINLALCTDNNVLTHSTHHHKYVTKS